MPQDELPSSPDFKTETVFRIRAIVKDNTAVLILNEGKEGFEKVLLFQSVEQFKSFTEQIKEMDV